MRKWSWIMVLALVWLLGACVITERTKRVNIMESISDRGCSIVANRTYLFQPLSRGYGDFETSTGLHGRSAIIVECK